MIYDSEIARELLVNATDLFSAICAILAILLLLRLRNQEGDSKTKSMLLKVFGILAVSFILYIIAEVWYVLTESFGYPDLFWLTGYFIEFLAFYYFVMFMYSENNKVVEGFLKVNVTLIFGGLLSYYLLVMFLPFETGTSDIEKIAGYAYPILSTLIAFVSLFCYGFVKNTGALGKSILLMTSANILTFFADGFWIYYTTKEVYGLFGILSDGIYAIYYIIYALAFFWLLRTLTNGKKHNSSTKTSK